MQHQIGALFGGFTQEGFAEQLSANSMNQREKKKKKSQSSRITLASVVSRGSKHPDSFQNDFSDDQSRKPYKSVLV